VQEQPIDEVLPLCPDSGPYEGGRDDGGVLETLAKLRSWAGRLFERLIGVETYGDVLSSGWLALWGVFRGLEVTRDDVFVDLGSGKGRVLYMAARRPFKRVEGIEWSEPLNRIARANLERNRQRLRCAEIKIRTLDIQEWEVPEDATVVYLYIAFPFSPEIPERLILKMRASVERNPRMLRLILPDPLPEHLEQALAGWRLEPLRARVPFYLRGRLAERSCIASLEPGAARGRQPES
jgi:SAM-dependent methyltransferase